MKLRKRIIIAFLCTGILLSFSTIKTFASELILRKALPLRTDMYFSNVARIPDPSIDTKTIYGYLGTSYAADSYYFIPSRTTIISIEVLVPARKSNENFRPGWEIVGENVAPQPMNIYFSVPPGSDFIGHDYYVDIGPRLLTTDPVTLEKLYTGNKQQIHVIQGKLYYINIYDPFHYIGDYVLKIGNKPDTMPLAQPGYFQDIYQIKTGLLGKIIDTRAVIAIFFCIIGFLLAGYALRYPPTNGKGKNQENLLFIAGNVLSCLGQMYLYTPNLVSGIALAQLLTWQLTIIMYVMYKKIPKSAFFFTAVSCLAIQVFLFVWYLMVNR